jgi:class 3 adenylate cyclase/pimeloyl-ACP methyl ester carboxylesterase
MGGMAGVPPTKYVRSGHCHLAYQVLGDGPVDLVYLGGGWGHLEARWDWPESARMLRRMASFSRLICFDKRGTGLSDRSSELPTLEQQVEDVTAVLDAVGSERAVLFGVADGGCMAVMYAALHPDRVEGLVTFATAVRGVPLPGQPGGVPGFSAMLLDRVSVGQWGDASLLPVLAPRAVEDTAFQGFWSRYERMAASPGAVEALVRVWAGTDMAGILDAVHVPTLVLQLADDHLVPRENGPALAAGIAGSRYVELPGDGYLLLYDGGDAVIDEVEEFVTGERHHVSVDRVLSTVLFTDIVGSTEQLAVVGDRRWRDMLEQHEELVGRECASWGGRLVENTGDGVMATFDGPARAVRCAVSLRERLLEELGVLIRAGVHTGEVELRGDRVVGFAVHLAARVCQQAEPGTVAVSSTVRDLTAGSGLVFADRGRRELKGVPDAWQLFEAVG